VFAFKPGALVGFPSLLAQQEAAVLAESPIRLEAGQLQGKRRTEVFALKVLCASKWV